MDNSLDFSDGEAACAGSIAEISLLSSIAYSDVETGRPAAAAAVGAAGAADAAAGMTAAAGGNATTQTQNTSNTQEHTNDFLDDDVRDMQNLIGGTGRNIRTTSTWRPTLTPMRGSRNDSSRVESASEESSESVIITGQTGTFDRRAFESLNAQAPSQQDTINLSSGISGNDTQIDSPDEKDDAFDRSRSRAEQRGTCNDDSSLNSHRKTEEDEEKDESHDHPP